MADLLDPVLTRQAVIDRQSLLATGEWVRWLDQLRTRLLVLGQSLSDLETLVDALEATVAALVQTTVLTLNVSGGEAAIVSPTLAPAGSTILGLSWRVAVAFNAPVASILLGDAVANDRWGQITNLMAGSSGGSAGWHAQPGFVTTANYTVILSPLGGNFGTAGSLILKCQWQEALTPP